MKTTGIIKNLITGGMLAVAPFLPGFSQAQYAPKPPVKQHSMLETKAVHFDNPTAKLIPVKNAKRTINPKTLEPEIKKETVSYITKEEGDFNRLVYSATGGYYYDEPTSDMIMASLNSFYGDQYLNPYIQPNLLNGGEPDLNYYGSGDVTGDNEIDWDDYNSIVGSTEDEADVDGNGTPGEQTDKNLLHGYLVDSIPYLPGHFDFLQDTAERNQWFRNYYLNVDTTDRHPPAPPVWDCDQYTMQFLINSSGIENIDSSGIDFDRYDTTNNAQGNMPVYDVSTVYTNGEAHAINGIFVGGPNADSTVNFDGWYFYEPQNDTRVYAGDPSMDGDYFANISKYVYVWSEMLQEFVYGMAQVINFNLDNSNPSVSWQSQYLITSRPEWQTHIHIGGEIPENITVDYEYGQDFSDPSNTGNVSGAASWADVFYSDSTTQEGSIYDSTYYNYTILRDWWAKSQDGLVIDTTYGSVDSVYNRPPQTIIVQDTTKPENTYNPGNESMSYSDFISYGLEDTEWDDNSGVVDVERNTSSTQGSDPTQCNYYNFSVDVMDVATDPSNNSDSAGFSETIYLDDSYWTYFPSDDSVPFYYPMIPDSTGGYASATNPVLGDVPVSYEMLNSTQDEDTTQPGHYQYDFDWQWTATDTICENSITDPQHVEVFKPESMVWSYVPADDTVTSEEGHDPSVTGGLAEASDTLLPWFEPTVNYSDSLVWAQDLDSLFYRTFTTEDIVGQSPEPAGQHIYQVYTTGMVTLTATGFLLYPNPATGQLFISADGEGTGAVHITVYSSSGMPVLAVDKEMSGSRPVALQISALPAGLYFVRLQSGNGITLKKFVKR